jgi:hypothetical protein
MMYNFYKKVVKGVSSPLLLSITSYNSVFLHSRYLYFIKKNKFSVKWLEPYIKSTPGIYFNYIVKYAII